MNTLTAEGLKKSLKVVSSTEKAKNSAWFFKTGPGQYGYGDKFLGVTVPQQRKVANKYKNLELREVNKLIQSPWHEHRLTALFILVDQFKRSDNKTKKQIYDFYMSNVKFVNNWDLVDSSAPYIVGPWLQDKSNKLATLTKSAKSDNLWQKRIAMISTFYFIQCGSAKEALAIANILLHDPHDLIQKSVGWMLREVGKRVDKKFLTQFLDKNAQTMPRTALRYAIERFSVDERAKYMSKMVK